MDEFGASGRRAGVVKGELVLLVEGCSEGAAAIRAMAAVTGSTDVVDSPGGEPGNPCRTRQAC